jgi:hypothetical protein
LVAVASCHLREAGTRVRVVSRHRGLTEDDGIEQIAADAHDEAPWRPPLPVPTALSTPSSPTLSTEVIRFLGARGSGRQDRKSCEAGRDWAVCACLGIGANTASASPYIRSRGEGEAAVQAASRRSHCPPGGNVCGG